tara:strand:+ start:141 stop:587 length:447 start_codon:yes stop_codon:yes gene_type:complete
MIITLVRKPLINNVCTTVTLCETGGINIDGTRIGTGTGAITKKEYPNMKGGNYGQDGEDYKDRENVVLYLVDKGRWPANVLLSESSIEHISIQGGESKSGVRQPTGKALYSTENTSVVWNSNNVKDTTVRGYDDSGSVVRYFKTVKEE